MINKILLNFSLALSGISQNKLRSLLTALGIIFGVFAVIAMMAIGSGAEKAIMEQLKIIGTNNIIINAVHTENKDISEDDSEDAKKSYSPGLSPDDIQAISNLLNNEEAISMEVGTDTRIIYGINAFSTTLLGVNNDFFEINNLKILKGSLFNKFNHIYGSNVCILGRNISIKLFRGRNPIGEYVKVKQVIFQVVGILQNRLISKTNYESLGIKNYGDQVFIPFQSYRLRIENIGKINSEDILQRGSRESNENYHQLDKIIVKVNTSSQVEASAAVIGKLLKRKHFNNMDYEIVIPELLIKQQQDTQKTLNFVFAIIAGISLLVGGIGVMNIMLASVMERIKEIGLRRAMGATKKDIVYQFLMEAIVISLLGGIIGIILGVLGAWLMAAVIDIPTVISLWSIFLSFVITVFVGIIFGFMPAKKAANLDPITALRTE